MEKTYTEIKLLWGELGISHSFNQCLVIDVHKQELTLYEQDHLIKTYPVSTASNGTGNEEGSFKTPYGFHRIDEKIGENQPINMLFKSRKATGEIALIDTPEFIEQDSITTRILWLSGLQEGVNLLGSFDTKQRYIYIHGTADEAHIGQAVSHGCIRMKNIDILELFDRLEDKAIVYIEKN